MKNGDISNETSPKIVVVAEVVANIIQPETPKRTGLFKGKDKESQAKLDINYKEVSHLWNLGNKYGLSIELAGFEDAGWTVELLESLMESLERKVSNPFNYSETYKDIDQFIQLLPFRGNLRGVVDLRERVARYGSYGVELDNL